MPKPKKTKAELAEEKRRRERARELESLHHIYIRMLRAAEEWGRAQAAFLASHGQEYYGTAEERRRRAGEELRAAATKYVRANDLASNRRRL